jgi:hypothetical protein
MARAPEGRIEITLLLFAGEPREGAERRVSTDR